MLTIQKNELFDAVILPIVIPGGAGSPATTKNIAFLKFANCNPAPSPLTLPPAGKFLIYATGDVVSPVLKISATALHQNTLSEADAGMAFDSNGNIWIATN